MFSPESPSQSTLSQSAKVLCFCALTIVMGLVDLGPAQAAPKIGDKQIDRPSAWTTWWCHQGNIPFVANGPDLTVVFQAEKYLPNDTGFAGQRLDNVAIVKKTVFDAHQVTAVAGCGQCDITQGGPSSLDLPNVSPSEFLFLDQFHSAVDPAWTLGTDAAFADTGQSGPFSAPNEFDISNCDESGGCLIFGEPGDPVGISDASFSISNLEEGVEYVLSFWWRSLNDIPQETPLLFVDLFGTTHWVDQTPGYLASTIYGVGVSFGDYDANGTQDLHISQTNFANQLLENVLTNFNDVTTGDAANPGPGTMALWADFLGNELPDLYVFNDGGPNLLLQNTGAATLVDVTPSPLDDADPATGGAVADFDNDGDLDIYLCKNGPNRLMRNDGLGTWVDAATLDARNPNVTRAAQFADFDLDGDQDLFLANDGASNVLLENVAGGYFDVTPVNIAANTDASFDVAWGDYDNDGDPDIYVSNMSGSNQLFRNDLGGVFTDVTTSPIDGSYETDAAEWFDADNDGDLDLYVGAPDAPDRIFRNDGNLVFKAMGVAPLDDPGTAKRGAAFADIDCDGRLDMAIGHYDNGVRIFRNVNPYPRNWIQIQLQGAASNTDGIGARIELWNQGQFQTREITCGSGYLSQSQTPAHFGLGSQTKAGLIRIYWPSGTVQDLYNVPANQKIVVTEQVTTTGVPEEPYSRPVLSIQNPIQGAGTFRYEVSESGPVNLGVVDVAGRLVRTLEDAAQKPSGSYTAGWNGRDERGRLMPTGIYFVRLQTQNQVDTQRVVYLQP